MATTETDGVPPPPLELLTVTANAELTLWLPAASRAIAVNVCEPFAVVVLFQATL